MRVEEEEEFEFLLDGISGEAFSSRDFPVEKSRLAKFLPTEYKVGNRNVEMLNDKYQALADIYKKEQEGKAYLIGYSEKEIKYDSFKDGESGTWCNYWLGEYIPEGKGNHEAHLEVRHHNTLQVNRQLIAKFNAEYRHFIYTLNPKRNAYENIVQGEVTSETSKTETTTPDFSTLTIWETKQKLVEALKNVKERILIESPWIKRATLEYIPLFQEILKSKKHLIILYGIDKNDEHDYHTLKQIEELQKQHPEYFKLINLPSHLSNLKSKLTGTHRKLLIKDNDYYLAGSFNFLSFGKNEKQFVANEESLLVTKDVAKKWEQLIKDYTRSL